MKIIIEVIPHKDQRYETCGDWQWQNDDLHIKVSRSSSWKTDALVAIHELIEAMICLNDGIDEDRVDRFDLMFERSGKSGEPGDDPRAPYYEAHQFATAIERLVCQRLDLPWHVHEKNIDAL